MGSARRDRTSVLARLGRLSWSSAKTSRTAGRRAFSRTVPVTQRHTGDRHHLKADLRSGPVGHAGADARYAANEDVLRRSDDAYSCKLTDRSSPRVWAGRPAERG